MAIERSLQGVLKLLALLLVAVAMTGTGCNSDNAAAARAALSEGCTVNTDCASPLVCAFRRCHAECKGSRDCRAPSRCVAAEKPYRVCELAGERKECTFTSDCTSPQVCAVDGICRAECRDARDCASEQICSYGTCADPDELSNGALAIKRPELAQGKPCILTSDCAGNLRCIESVCTLECRTNLDCAVGQCQNGTCSGGGSSGTTDGGGAGQACERSSECPGDLFCVQRTCRVECEGPKDCAVGQTCTAQRCVLTGGGGTSGTGGSSGTGGGNDGGPDATVTDGGPTPASCTNGVQDGTETDIDCGGGSCAACGNTRRCVSQNDCSSRVCTSSVCQAPTCTDGVKNGPEGDTDCGGGCPNACSAGQTCVAYTDCSTGLCAGGRCRTAGCFDGVKNGTETDIDCGGPNCSPCAPNRVCTVNADCSSSLCSAGACTVSACSDTVKNGNETDVDCGGGICGKCADQKVCLSASDCLSANCVGNRCQPASCTDGVMNNAETDRDCGGGACALCSTGARCTVNNDCLSGLCETGLCQAMRCNDTRKNGLETDVDCGGIACPACGAGKTCAVDSDCRSKRCFNSACLEIFTLTVQKQGTGPGRVSSATDIDCGETCAADYSKDAQVTLTAQAVPGATFTGWSGAGCTGTGTCTVTMSQALTVTATFDAVFQDYTALFAKAWPVGVQNQNHTVASADIDPSGEFVVAGNAARAQPIDLGTGPLVPVNDAPFVARYSSVTGITLWARLYEGMSARINDVIVGPDSFVWTGGEYGTSVVRYDLSNGDVRSSRDITPLPNGGLSLRYFLKPTSPVTDAFFVSEAGFACGECTDDRHLITSRLRSADLATVWLRNVCGQEFYGNTRLATDSANNVLMSANGWGYGTNFSSPTCNFGSGNMTYPPGSAIVVKWDANNALRWTRSIGGIGGRTAILGIVTDSLGDVYVSGQFAGQILINPSRLLTAVGANDAFLVKISGATGAVLWGRRFGTTADGEALSSMQLLPNDELLVYGVYPPAVAYNFDGVSLPSRPAGTNWFLAKFNASGTLLSVRQPGNGTVQGLSRIRVNIPSRKLILLGRTANGAAANWGDGVTIASAPFGVTYATLFQVN